MLEISEKDMDQKLKDKLSQFNVDISVIGNDELKTKDKSIKGSINELYDKDEYIKSLILQIFKQRGFDIKDDKDLDQATTDIFNKIIGEPGIQKVLEELFGEDELQERAKTINIPKLISIDEITVDNGNVKHTVSGENVDITVSSGDPIKKDTGGILTKEVTDSKTSSSDSFPESLEYNQDGYKGTLNKDGSSFVSSGSSSSGSSKYVEGQDSPNYNSGGYSGTLERYLYSGSYIPSDSKKVTTIQSYNISDKYKYTSKGWVFDHSTILIVNYESFGRKEIVSNINEEDINKKGYEYAKSCTFNYDKDGYKCTLNYINTISDGTHYKELPSNANINDIYEQSTTSGQFVYGGTAIKPAVDTRVYKYKGTVYSSGYDTRVYNQNYKGTVTKRDEKEVEDIKTSSSNSFSSTMEYNKDGYKGTLNKDGDSYISSGKYTPKDTKEVSGETSSNYDKDGYKGTLESYLYSGSYIPRTKTVRKEATWTVPDRDIDKHLPWTIEYNEDGYSGTLHYDKDDPTSKATVKEFNDFWDKHPDKEPEDFHGLRLTYAYKGTVTNPNAYDSRVYRYRGTVTRPESDTRVYAQKYKGKVLKVSTMVTYYKYKVTIKCTVSVI